MFGESIQFSNPIDDPYGSASVGTRSEAFTPYRAMLQDA